MFIKYILALLICKKPVMIGGIFYCPRCGTPVCEDYCYKCGQPLRY